MAAIAEEQEVMGAIADMIVEVFVMESAILRADKIGTRKTGSVPNKEVAVAMARVYAAKAMEIVELSARRVIAAVAEGDMLRTQLTILRRLAKHDPADTIALKRQVAEHIVRAGKYML
jgi:butyryl-CoA dehydrogenase